MLDIAMDDARLRMFMKAAPRQTVKAARMAMRRTAQAANTELLAAMKASTHLSPGRLRAAILKPFFANGAQGVEARLKVQGHGFGLDQYKVKPNTVTARKGRPSTRWRGPSWRIGPTDRWHQTPRTFMAIMRNGAKPILMQRTGRKLRRLYGPSPQYFAAFVSVQRRVGQRAREMFPKRFLHEIARLLGK